MGEPFYCQNKECQKTFCLEVPDEIMIDESNMAQLFCPHCSGHLKRFDPPPELNPCMPNLP